MAIDSFPIDGIYAGQQAAAERLYQQSLTQIAAKKQSILQQYGYTPDFTTLAGYFAAFERRGSAINLGTFVGAGSVREYLLIKRVQFRLHDADGNEWLPPGEIALRRTYSFSESEVLARDTQEQRLLKEMQTDAVQQLVRRLQAAKKPA